MADGPILCIRQESPINGKYPIRLTLKRSDWPEIEAEATVEFALTPQEQSDLRWYLEDYPRRWNVVERVQVEQIEHFIKKRGVELYERMLEGSRDVQRIFDRVVDIMPDLRVEVRSGIAEAASIPWELMREPQSDSPIALRVKSFVRVQSNPNLNFVPVPLTDKDRVRLLYVVCRPNGANDVPLRVIANRLLQDLGNDLARFDIKALRPPTFEQLQRELQDAKEAGRPYHIVHFDGHGIYANLSETTLAGWVPQLSSDMLGGKTFGKHGYLIFEHPDSDEKIRPVSGDELGKLLHDTGVPTLVLNACQSAMHEATEKPEEVTTVHDEVRSIGSLAQGVVDQGIPAVLGMRYSVFVVTAAQYIGELYAALAKGREFGQAATEGRKHLYRNRERWVGLQALPLQDWCVPVVYEAAPLRLLPTDKPLNLGQQAELDPVQKNVALRRYVPDIGFVGRDETLHMLDRSFDNHPVVLLHAYAGEGKTATSVEFSRWYARTGGLGPQPVVVFSSFESYTTLTDALHHVGLPFIPLLKAHGIEWHAINSSAERRELMVQLFRQLPVLWIWDNVEPVAGFPEGTESAWTRAEQAELFDFLKQLKFDKATKVKILITSRRDERKWLGGIPHRVQMPRMSFLDSAELALKLGQERGLPRSEIADWQQLLNYCAGNPLTLRLIVGQAVTMDLKSREQIELFVQALRDGEQRIEDGDKSQDRDKSLRASLDYGFRKAFTENELPAIALLHLFRSTADVEVMQLMGVGEHALPEVQGKDREWFMLLLERAKNIGLLTSLHSNHYTIHPALPWFLRQLFASYYDGQDGRSSAEAALRSWVEAVGELGTRYHNEVDEGDHAAMAFFALKETNLLRARRLARNRCWWSLVISAMQGLRTLYQYQSREAEWARLIAEIVPDYCTTDDGPISGREEDYGLVMAYRIMLVQDQERDLTRAAALQKKLVAWNRLRAADALAVPEDVPLDGSLRHRLHELAGAVSNLGVLRLDQGSVDCVKELEEAIRFYQRINATSSEANVFFNLGHAYRELSDIRNLDAAEAAYRRSLDLRNPSEALQRSLCIKQIGMIHHDRFREALSQDEPAETVLRHWQAAEEHYQRGATLCPASAISYLGPMYNQLGNLYREVNETGLACDYYEKDLQICLRTGNRYSAGQTRRNIAVLYWQAARRQKNSDQNRDELLRAKAYGRASLRDFQHYEGRCSDEETKTQALLHEIEEDLAKLAQ